jgi:hypothetical protein
MKQESVMLRSTLLIGLLALSAAAGAEGFSYNWAALGYGMVDFDDIDVDGDGFGIDGSYALNDDFHVFGTYEAIDLDFGVDATTFSAGIGYNTEMSPAVDAFARLSYEYVEVDMPLFGSDDDSGYGFGVGLRFAAGPGVELNAGIDYVDYGSGGDDTSLSLGGLYNFTPAFALGLHGSWGDDVSSYSLSGRFYFGK